jgi:hypothetical protein
MIGDGWRPGALIKLKCRRMVRTFKWVGREFGLRENANEAFPAPNFDLGRRIYNLLSQQAVAAGMALRSEV